MIQLRKRPPSFWPLLSLFFAITISTVLVGFIYFFYQKKNILREKQNELSAISYLGIRQITQWRDERIGDAKFLEENGLLAGKFSEYLRNPQDLRIRDNIIQNLKSLTDHFDYGEALVLRDNGLVSLGYPKSDTATQNLKSLLPSVLANKRAIFYDQPPTDKEKFFRIDLIIPLIDRDHNDTVVKGFLDLRIDPSKTLYPILKSWPTSYKSTETILIKRANDKIVLLNKPDDILSPVLAESANKQLIADMAIHGITGTINGIDCSGNVVVAALNKIPDTSWYLIVKVDRKEVLASLTSQVKLILIILLLIIIASGSFLAFLIRSQRAVYYREKYEDELSRLALIKHFDYILKYANDIILLINSDLVIVEANDRALEYYKYTREEFIGKYVNEIRAKETRDQIEEDIRKVNSNGSATFETIHLRKDNSTFPVEVSTRVVTIENAKYYQSISRDITDRKKVENILRESEEKFRKIFQESPYSTLMTGKDFEILKANSTFCNLIGYSEDELKQFTFRNFTHPDHIKNDEIGLLKLIAGEIPVYKCEKRYIKKNGSEILASTNVSIIRDKNDEVQFFLVMIEDITSRKKAEEELITAKEKAEESDRLKTAFLHNVSHEIRTPMNAIIGFSSLMRDMKLSEAERNQYVEIIYQSGEQLLSIINDIVDIANIESGQVKVNLSELNLNSALKKLNEQFILSSSQKNISINLLTAFSDEKSDIQTDGTKLIQIISNLINNAIKFTKDGKIDFGYTLNDRFIEFFVSDSGIGIPKEHLERIFDRFYQVDSAISRKFSGTGLGLSICKGYVELLGGTIGVESEPGSGTKFSFSIPYTL
jgi:PAS domain S-box-containing protein